MQSVIEQPARAVCAPKIIRATHMGMCFGVRDAIEMASRHSAEKPITILGDLVHNEKVLGELHARGIRIGQSLADVTTPEVMITAHGASDAAIQRARAQGLRVTEATCPLVRHAHRMVQKLALENYHPVIIGKRDHVEVRGLTEDLESFDVVLSEADVNQLSEHPKFGIVSQTTQAAGKVRSLVELIRYRFPNSEIRHIDTICQPTKQRQSAAIELAQKSDVVIVIGGANSNNTRELANTCGRFYCRVRQVRDQNDLRLEWFEGARTIGITAGTSTPDSLIDEVEQWIARNV